MNYRISAIEEGRLQGISEDYRRVPRLCQGHEENNTPGGFALGHASGDGNAWVHWCLWAHGGNLVDENDKVILNSPETEKALEYAKQLSENLIPGIASWNDASNNKAFLAGEIHWTDNGISIYVSRQGSDKKDIAEDMDHAYWPIGPIGKPTELHLLFPMLAMNYTKFPQACKALIAFMMEADQLQPVDRNVGGLSHPGPHRLREKSGLDLRSKARCIPRRRRAHAHGRRARLSRRKSGGGALRLRGARHVRQLLHRTRGLKRRNGRGRAAGEAYLSLIRNGRAAHAVPPPPLFSLKGDYTLTE